jgi:hypothetical protein
MSCLNGWQNLKYKQNCKPDTAAYCLFTFIYFALSFFISSNINITEGRPRVAAYRKKVG